MKNIHKPKVGQQLFVISIGRYNSTEYFADVTKVGRKYFTVNRNKEHTNYNETIFCIDDWREKTGYGASLFIYNSKQEWEDEKEHKEIESKIHDISRYRGLDSISLNDLRQVSELLGLGDL